MNNSIEILRSAKEVFGEDYRGLINQISSDLIDAQKALKYSKRKYRLFNPEGAEFAIDHLIMFGYGLTEDENILINLVAEKIQQIMINRAEIEAKKTAENTEETAESTEETAESTEETAENTEETAEYYISGVKIDKYTADDLYWEEIAYCSGYAPELAAVEVSTDKNSWSDATACDLSTDSTEDEEKTEKIKEVIEEVREMSKEVNDVESSLFFFTDRGQLALSRIRVNKVKFSDFQVGNFTDKSRKIMNNMKPMNWYWSTLNSISLGYLIQDALKVYSEFYRECYNCFCNAKIEGSFDEFFRDMRLSVCVGEIDPISFVA